MKRTKNSENIKLNVINVYNTDNKPLKDLQLLFNKKLLNMIYNLEKNFFYSEKADKNMLLNERLDY